MQNYSSFNDIPNVGIVLDNLGPNQLAYFVIKNANQNSRSVPITLFYQNLALPCLDTNIPVMCVNEIWPFKGKLIATSIETAIAVNNVVSEVDRYFYVNDLEWIRGKSDFIHNMQAFHSNIQIFARSKEHAQIIENYSNRKVIKILPYFDVKEIVNDKR